MSKPKKNKDLRNYPSKYPSKVRRSLPDAEWVKARTIELYDYLPQTTLEERYTYTDIRDEVIYINYNFFYYVASNCFVSANYISYEDKFQAALYNFCVMWHKYRFTKKYRADLAFSVFFKPRLNECIWRNLTPVKYSTNRSLKMEASQQIGKYYKDLKYEDLSNIKLPIEKMNALKACFKVGFEEDIDEVGVFLPSNDKIYDVIDEVFTDEYDSIEGVLINEMIEQGRLLEDKDLQKLSTILDIPVGILNQFKECAEVQLKQKLQDAIHVHEVFH